MGKAETDYQLGSDPVELERLGQQGRVPAPATPMAARQQEGGSTCQGLPTVLLAFFYSVFRLLLDVPSMGVTGGRPPPSQPDGRRIEAGRSDPPRPHRGPAAHPAVPRSTGPGGRRGGGWRRWRRVIDGGDVITRRSCGSRARPWPPCPRRGGDRAGRRASDGCRTQGRDREMDRLAAPPRGAMPSR
jgi:hypothetical protein